ncbi:hypothetical protein BH24ACT23_BH24ACT23_00210 [soil metagenome]
MNPTKTLLAISAIVAALAALAPATADAGTYKAIQCHARVSAGHADASFHATSDHYRREADCDGRGLGITHVEGRKPTGNGRYGSWTLTAPAGTELIRAAARVSARGQSRHQPRISVGLGGGSAAQIRDVNGDLHTVSWTGTGGRSLTGRLICTNRDRCGHGRDAHLHMRRIALTLRDDSEPTVALGGSLLADGARRGRQTLEVSTSDAGSGVRQVTVEVNGTPLAARVLDCALAGRIATRLRPCPGAPTPHFDLDTEASGFRQGPNQLRVCATDYAPRATANRTCETAVVRIDNLCPLAEVDGAELRARFAGRGEQTTTTSDSETTVVGSIRDQSGSPLRGAKVCIATRVAQNGRPERVLATPVTGPDGTFRVTIPAGPSRDVRIAHWPNRERALEAMLELTSRVVPRLRIRPEHGLRNGSKARFRVGIPGPASAGRRVAIEARANGRWIRIDGGRTNKRGRFIGSYRFRSTTGTRRYAFRAVVPGQRGYPYAPGRSKVRRVTVVGG